MATRAEVNLVLRQLFRELLGLPNNSIRPANQMAPTGEDELFGTVNIITLNLAQWAHKKLENDPDSEDLIETIIGSTQSLVSVQFFRTGSFDTLTKLSLALQTSNAVYRMQELGIGLARIGSVRDLTAVVDAHYEERAQMDLVFNINSFFVANVRAILSAQFSIHLEDGTSQYFELEFEQ